MMFKQTLCLLIYKPDVINCGSSTEDRHPSLCNTHSNTLRSTGRLFLVVLYRLKAWHSNLPLVADLGWGGRHSPSVVPTSHDRAHFAVNAVLRSYVTMLSKNGAITDSSLLRTCSILAKRVLASFTLRQAAM